LLNRFETWNFTVRSATIEFAGDFFVGEVFQQRVQDFLLAAAQIGDGIGLQSPALPAEDGIHETGEHGTRHPESAGGD